MEKNINKNQNCHDELLAQLSENCDNVEKLAASEINNLEFVMPDFSSLGSLSRYKFNLFLKKIKKVRDSAEYLATLTAICVDTLTCMIKNSSFYEAYMFENKTNLHLLEEIIGITYMVVKNIPLESLSSLIIILERSAARIQFKEISFFDELTMYINRFRYIEKLIIDDKWNRQNTKDPNFKNTKPIADASESFIKTITPVPIKNSDNCMKELNGAQGSFQHKKLSDTSHVIGIEKPAANWNQIKEKKFGSEVMQENKEVAQLIKKDISEPKKQPSCFKRPRDDTNFDQEKENLQPPRKILKLEPTNNMPSCYVKIENNKNAFEVLMSRRVVKKK